MAKLEEMLRPNAEARSQPQPRLRAAFINTGVASCSIYESGLMVHDCIRESSFYSMDYFSLSDFDVEAFARDGKIRPSAGGPPLGGYDFWVFNWHFITMAMALAPEAIAKLPGLKFTVVLELSPGDPLKLVPENVFDGYIALDPAAPTENGIFPFPRPLQGAPRRPPPSGRQVPVIGSFGFGTPGKGFEQLIEAVNHEFDRAIVRINVPSGTYIGTDVVHRGNYARRIEAVCKRIAKPGIDVRFSFDFMSAEELVDWCEANDLNCFMYTRCQPGLSATTDQAIQSGRPLATLSNDTFRHIHKYIPAYPVISLREAMETSVPRVYQMQEDWSREAFNRVFHSMVSAYGLKASGEVAAPHAAAETRHRPRILVASRNSRPEVGAMDYTTRIADSLGRTSEFEIERATVGGVADLKANVERVRPFGVIMLDFASDEAGDLRGVLENVPGPKILLQDRAVIDAAKAAWGGERENVLPRDPIVPFFTVQVARHDPPLISLIGFSAPTSNLEKVVAGILRETPNAEVQVEARPFECEAVASRIAQFRAAAGVRADARITVAPLPQDGETLVNALAEKSLIILHNDATRTVELEDIGVLAMTTERAVVFTRAARFPAYAGLETCFEDYSVRDAINLGLSAQIGVRHAFGEWRFFADIHRLMAQGLSTLGRSPEQLPELAQQPAAATAPVQPQSAALVTAASILALEGEAFVRAVYQSVLKRNPDADGLRHYMALLAKGVGRHTILASVRLSPEGRGRNVDFPGLTAVLRRHRMLTARAFSKLARIWNGGDSADVSADVGADLIRAIQNEERLAGGTENKVAIVPTVQPAAAQMPAEVSSRTAQFGVGVDMFVLVGVEGSISRVAGFVARLEQALRDRGEGVRPVVWSRDDKRFRLANRCELDILGVSLEAGAHELPADDAARIVLEKGSIPAGGWLLVADREHVPANEPDLIELNMILEAKRLGLRTGFIFHGADPLKHEQFAGPVADSFEMYMQTLLLADAVIPVSKVAEDDLNDFLVQHQLADTGPFIAKAPVPADIDSDERVGWGEYARRMRSLLSDAANSSRRLSAIYLWVGPQAAAAADAAFAGHVARALAGHGVRVLPAAWDAARGQLVAAHPAWASDAGGWIEPGHGDAPRWLLAPHGVRTDILPALQSFAQAHDFRLAATLSERSSGDSAALAAMIPFDKVFAASPDTQRNLYRHILTTRVKATSADHRYVVLAQAEEIDGRPRMHAPRIADPGVVRVLINVPAGAFDVSSVLESLKDVAERSQDRLVATFVGEASPSAEARIQQARAEAGFGVHWEGAVSGERLGQLIERTDFAVLPGRPDQQTAMLRECQWHATPCLLNSAKASNGARPAATPCVDHVDMDEPGALAEALLKLVDPAWRRCLGNEAAKRSLRTWSEYAHDLAVVLASDRPREALYPLRTEGRPDIYARLVNLKRRPKLSICISTYNRAGWVDASLRNIFAQIPTPRPDIEVLVVDNTATDNTPEVVAPHLHRPDFRYVRNPKNVGMLGNLAVTAQRARGEHIWILGDDDLTRRGVIDKVMQIITDHPGIPLVYMNYGYTSEEFPQNIKDLNAYTDGYNVLEPAGPDVLATGKAIAAKCENFYTAIYSHLYRRAHGLRAYSQETSGRTFATMVACIPTAYYVIHYMPELPAYWIGEPSLVVNSRVSWAQYGPMLDLEHLPATWDLAERAGCPAEEVDRRRANRLWLVKMMWRDLFENDVAGNSPYISAPKVLMRLNHLPEMAEHIGEIRAIYEKAHAAGHPGATMPPAELFSGWA